ncbi:MAG TPA: hypothetical protein PLF22_03735 [Pseudomonadales bacterium]|nr:hypothetical protein [Pseudomonadales bacterium]
MTDTASTHSHLQRLLVGYLVTAKTELDDATYQNVYALLPGYLAVANEMVSIEVLADRSMLRHAIHSLAAGNSVEETLMYTFMLNIYQLTNKSTRHPLEMGIIRQRIIALLPIFAKARDKGHIRHEVYASNEALMMSIADKTDDMEEALAMLANGYARYADAASNTVQ